LLERGFDFLSNDRVIVRAGSQSVVAYGLPKQPRVNPGTLLAGTRTTSLLDEERQKRYRKMSDRELWKVEDKHDLDIGATLGRQWVPYAPLSFAVALQWRHDGKGLTLEQLDPGQALEVLRGAAKTFGPFDLHLEERPDAPLRAMARTVPLYRVSGAIDPPRLARELAERLAGSMRV
jgi:HprK-related kinase B